MNSNINVFVGAILGFDRKKSYSNFNRLIGKVTEVSERFMSIFYQSDEGKSTLNVYEFTSIIRLPLTEELLDNTTFFTKVENKWISPNSSVIISKNTEDNLRKWNVAIFDENHNMISNANFNYIDELQSYCYLAQVDLDLKLGTIRTLYQNYIENV